MQRLEPTSETKDLLANHIQYSHETNHNVPTSDNIAVCMYISFFSTNKDHLCTQGEVAVAE